MHIATNLQHKNTTSPCTLLSFWLNKLAYCCCFILHICLPDDLVHTPIATVRRFVCLLHVLQTHTHTYIRAPCGNEWSAALVKCTNTACALMCERFVERKRQREREWERGSGLVYGSLLSFVVVVVVIVCASAHKLHSIAHFLLFCMRKFYCKCF